MAKSGIYLYPELLESQAFDRLTKNGHKALLRFMQKRVINTQPSSPYRKQSKKVKLCVNNGSIQFSFNEAQNKFRWDRTTFNKLLKQLISLGFIYRNHRGGRFRGDINTFFV